MENILEDIIPTEYELAQNYPNPFKEKTTIKYCLPDTMRITLKVFNSSNRKIKTLLNEIKEAGTYKVELNTNGLESGEYICKLETTDFFDMIKMIVL